MSVQEKSRFECGICFDIIAPEERQATTCAHLFHRACLEKWFAEKRSCPQCQTEQPNPDSPRRFSILLPETPPPAENPWRRLEEMAQDAVFSADSPRCVGERPVAELDPDLIDDLLRQTLEMVTRNRRLKERIERFSSH